MRASWSQRPSVRTVAPDRVTTTRIRASVIAMRTWPGLLFSAGLSATCLLLVTGGCGEDPDESAGSETAAATDGSTGADTDTASGGESETGSAIAPTWYQDIAPLVAGSCGGCHRDGGIAPFSLTTYESAAGWAGVMAASVEAGTMPPFLAHETDECQPRFGWQDDTRLSDDEQALLRAWADAGAPEGDPTNPAPLPEPPNLELQDADMRLTIPSAVTIDGNKDNFLCFSVDPDFDVDAWVEGIQITAGNPEIVHHVLVYVDEEAASDDLVGPEGYYPCFGGVGLGGGISLIGAWAPGMPAAETPPDVAMRIPAGARLVINVHYHPTGSGPAIDDATSVDLRFHPSLPQYVGILALIGNASGPSGGGEGLQPDPNDRDGKVEFRIPAGVADHTEQMLFSLDDIPEVRVYSAGTHMHYVGTDMMVGIQRPTPDAGEPESECLIQTPKWDFNWQRGYAYDAPLDQVPRISSGDKLYLRCKYNNSMSNPFVAQALAEQGLPGPVDVYLGEETLDEMCLGVFGLAINLADLL